MSDRAEARPVVGREPYRILTVALPPRVPGRVTVPTPAPGASAPRTGWHAPPPSHRLSPTARAELADRHRRGVGRAALEAHPADRLEKRT